MYTAYLLGGAYGARAHAHSESISTSCYKVAGLSACHHIAGNDLQIWMGLLQMLQHLYLVDGVPCTGLSYSQQARLDNQQHLQKADRWCRHRLQSRAVVCLSSKSVQIDAVTCDAIDML